jgi:PAS domain S-box-containing protein
MPRTKILVVEAESIVAEDIRSTLESLGYGVTSVASSAQDAVKKAEDDKPDLVLMDIVLHGRINGIAAANQIRARVDIPVVYLTADADQRMLDQVKVTEPFGYILKPFEGGGLYVAIEIALYKHKMERRLKKSEEWLWTTLKSIGDAVIATDTKGCVAFMNPVAESSTGWKQEDALGKELTNVFHIINEETREIAENPVSRVLREGALVGLANHTALVSKDGVEISIADSGAPIRDDKGNIKGVILVYRDITEHRLAEKEQARLLQESRKLATELERAIRVKDEFQNVMSHELRTPLNVVVGYTAIIKDRFFGDITPKQEEALGEIMNTANDQLAMINTMLLATALEAGKTKIDTHEVRLVDFLNQLKQAYDVPMKKSITFNWDYPSDLPSVNTDSAKLKHILQNLINNAIKFTDRGNVTVSAHCIVEAKRVEFKVVDTGIGISEDHFPFIFEKFRQIDISETRTFEGVGVGLYIVKQFTELLGGTVEVESVPDKGSTFTVRIPYES